MEQLKSQTEKREEEQEKNPSRHDWHICPRGIRNWGGNPRTGPHWEGHTAPKQGEKRKRRSKKEPEKHQIAKKGTTGRRTREDPQKEKSGNREAERRLAWKAGTWSTTKQQQKRRHEEDPKQTSPPWNQGKTPIEQGLRCVAPALPGDRLHLGLEIRTLPRIQQRTLSSPTSPQQRWGSRWETTGRDLQNLPIHTEHEQSPSGPRMQAQQRPRQHPEQKKTKIWRGWNQKRKRAERSQKGKATTIGRSRPETRTIRSLRKTWTLSNEKRTTPLQ